jgi:hypothetical protein
MSDCINNIEIPDKLTDDHYDVRRCLELLCAKSEDQKQHLQSVKQLLVRCYSALLEYNDLMPVELGMFHKPSPQLQDFMVAHQQRDGATMIAALEQLLPPLAAQQQQQRTGEAILLALELKSIGNVLGLLQQNPKKILATNND